MKTRFLAIFSNEDGEPKSAMIETNDSNALPFGAERRIVAELEDRNMGYNSGGGLVLVEMPTAVDFRPTVVNAQDDDEIEMTFITI